MAKETTTKSEKNTVGNPKTGDNIGIFILLGTISLIGLVLTFISKRHLKKVFIFIGMVTILIPVGVLAVTKISKFEIVFKNDITSSSNLSVNLTLNSFLTSSITSNIIFPPDSPAFGPISTI